MQPVVATMPHVGRVTSEPYVRRGFVRVDVQNRGVLAALFLAVIEFIERCPVAVQVVIIKRRRHAGHDGEQRRVLEPQSNRPLPTHADPGHGNGLRSQLPGFPHPRQDAIQDVPLRSLSAIKLRTNAIGPPRLTGLGRTTRDTVACEFGSVGFVLRQCVAGQRVQKQQPKLGPVGRLINRDRLAANGGRGPVR